MSEGQQREGQVPEPDPAARSSARSAILSKLVARMLLIGGGVALLIGIVGAVAMAYATSLTTAPSGYALARTCTELVNCLLAAGVLAAFGAVILLQVSRTEVEYVDS
jgi:hypothetical protein